MKKYLFLSIFATLAAFSTCEAAKSDSLILGSGSADPKLVVNNRILVKVNGKVISVIDLMKKMDMLFYKQFPQYATSLPARCQFYLANWKSVLNEIIDKELILADAEEAKLVVSQGDVREEMESLFGPNIHINLDKAGLSFSEASKMVLDDISMRRMLYFRVQSKAISRVTPQAIRKFYDEVAKDNIRDNEWVYNVITIRHKDATKAAETANSVYRILTDDKAPLADLAAKLQEVEPKTPKSPTVTVSEEFQTNEKELSDSYKKILVDLSADSYSLPISQKSRADNSTVVRLFYLKKMTPGGVIPYSELADRIKGRLIDDEINKETEVYLTKLRQQYHVQDAQMQEIVSSDFQPFELD